MYLDQRFISHMLTSVSYSNSAQAVVKWQYNLFGDFYTHLFKAISHADQENLRRLELGFPAEVLGYKEFTRGTMAEWLQLANAEYLKKLENNSE